MPDTIVALATPAGRSGIGVIRLSGPEAYAYTGRLCGDPELRLQPRHATLKSLADIHTGEFIDESVLIYFKAPHSFTGEDVVEISCHGSPVLLRQVIDACLELGARMAEPGEFTLRALANGRMNLAQAEAVRDLIDAQTAASARQAVRQLRGEFSNRLQPIKDDLLDVIVVLESALEFVEDDLPETQTTGLRVRLRHAADEIDRIASTFKAGRLLREGLKVTLVGRPNVGKSSLFNALLGTDRAIVTEIAGTTRDQINESFSVDGFPVTLMDTAGLRDTTDTVESIGVERSRRAMADADVVVVVIDASEPFTQEDAEVLEGARGLRHIVVVNKVDKINEQALDHVLSSVGSVAGDTGEQPLDPVFAVTRIPISAKTGHGVNELKKALLDPFSAASRKSHADTSGPADDGSGPEPSDSGFLVTDARHYDLLVRSRDELLSSLHLFDDRASEELTLIGLHNALRFLGQITGETTTEDMLTRIFSTFCIGK